MERRRGEVLSVLDRVTTFAVEDGGGTLVLSGPGGELRFQRDLTPVAPPAPAAPWSMAHGNLCQQAVGQGRASIRRR
jgi:hypothetical protein